VTVAPEGSAVLTSMSAIDPGPAPSSPRPRRRFRSPAGSAAGRRAVDARHADRAGRTRGWRVGDVGRGGVLSVGCRGGETSPSRPPTTSPRRACRRAGSGSGACCQRVHPERQRGRTAQATRARAQPMSVKSWLSPAVVGIVSVTMLGASAATVAGVAHSSDAQLSGSEAIVEPVASAPPSPGRWRWRTRP
jgi:hypothetical protein